MNHKIQTLAASLDNLSTNLRSIPLDVIEKQGEFVDGLRKNALDQLRSGFIPSSTSDLKEFSQDAYLILQSVEKALARARCVLETLTEGENMTGEAVSCSQTLIYSPIRNLPPEILLKVFNFYIFPSRNSRRDENALSLAWDHDDQWHCQISCPTMRLSWVCSYWHQILLSQPTFWSSLYLGPVAEDSQAEDQINKFMKIAPQYISRSRDELLKFLIVDFSYSYYSEIVLLLDVLLDHRVQWHHVVLGIELQNWYPQAHKRLGFLNIGNVAPDDLQVSFPNLVHLETHLSPLSYF
ncbi:uncharacterized protein C8R40DRAFT_1170361 [Lentinula edodes]|uniref:uncharacterized protein n=1 Tax=Lentinula edodes TaxID=5353 RepID=UPI001E8CEF8C|nr:uncharacterized protein C8R40DRAFT_1170361 [Lentinula edodes]KAH7875748.1 hypothetical protein C8R40DRAFT_1170361 [Lentinula edodes]